MNEKKDINKTKPYKVSDEQIPDSAVMAMSPCPHCDNKMYFLPLDENLPCEVCCNHCSTTFMATRKQPEKATISLPTDEAERLITEKCVDLNKLLIDKNRRYGNSSLEPIGIFPSSRESKIEARISDKLARIKNTYDDKQSKDFLDAVKDVTGYFILYQIALESD